MATPLALHEGPKPDTITNPSLSPPGPTSNSGRGVTMTATENPDRLWQTILDLGAPAHEWVERFFWYWFTDGARAASSPADFVRLWRPMILHAAASPRWDRAAFDSYRIDGMVIELLGLDGRWFGQNADYASPVATLADTFRRAAELWFGMPRILRSFLSFIVQPVGLQLILPAIGWLVAPVQSLSRYDWRDGIEEGLVLFLHTAWQRERARIMADEMLQRAFFDLLTTVVSRGSHPAIALRDRISGSSAANTTFIR